MITRSDYMKNSSKLHRAFFSQFVNEEVKARVIEHIGIPALLRSVDPHLNDIPLKKWDQLAGFVFRSGEMIQRPLNIWPIDIRILKQAGEGVSNSVLVCIYKEAGKQIIEGYKEVLYPL